MLSLPILYLSRYIIHHKEDYYRLLLDVTSRGNWENWILFILAGVEETAQWTTQKINAIRSLQAHTGEYVKTTTPKVYSHELITLIFELPYARIQNVMELGLSGRQAASRYLKSLVDIGVLREQKAGREKLFVHPKFMRLLTSDDSKFLPYTSNPTRVQKP